MILLAAREVFSIMLLLSHRDLTYHMILVLLSHFAATQRATQTAEQQINIFQGERWKYGTF